MKKALILAAALAATVPAFAFNATQTQAQITKEVGDRLAKKESLESIAAAAQAAGVTVNPLSMAMTFFGSADAVLGAMMAAGYDAGSVVNALVALGGSRDALVATAIAKGADPAKVTAATAAGNNNQAGNNQAGNTAGLSNFQGFAGNSIRSVSSSVGSGNSVSRN